MSGRKVTGPNGKSIFLPAAGYRGGTYPADGGYNGVYWSSSLYTDGPDSAWGIDFYSDDVGGLFSGYREYGLSVRPVSD